jgi:hypothetical protein
VTINDHSNAKKMQAAVSSDLGIVVEALKPERPQIAI